MFVIPSDQLNHILMLLTQHTAAWQQQWGFEPNVSGYLEVCCFIKYNYHPLNKKTQVGRRLLCFLKLGINMGCPHSIKYRMVLYLAIKCNTLFCININVQYLSATHNNKSMFCIFENTCSVISIVMKKSPDGCVLALTPPVWNELLIDQGDTVMLPCHCG